MKRLVLAALALGLAGCSGNPPPEYGDLILCLATCDGQCEKQENGNWACIPDPDPEPTPTPPPPPPPPPPDPTPEPVCVPPDLVHACWHKPPGQDWQWIPPKPPPPDPVEPGPCPQGRAQARGPIPHAGEDVYDATPAVCNADWTPDCYTGRYCHPVACEGEEHAAQRELCETELMGVWKPEWKLKHGDRGLYLVPHRWFGIVRGKGEDELRWCFPNGRACSKWRKVVRE